MTLNQHYITILNTYAEWLATLGFADSTLYNYPKTLSHFLTWLTEKNIHHITQVNTNIIYQYFKYLEQRPHQRKTNKALSSAHLNKNFDAIDKLCECLDHMGMTHAPSPTKYRIRNQYQPKFTLLSKEEIQDLYSAVPLCFLKFNLAYRTPRQAILRLVLDLCYGCGLRRKELTSLTLKDINFDKKVVHIRQAKGYKDRYVPMSRQVYQSIQQFVYMNRKYFGQKPKMLFPYTDYYIPICIDTLVKATKNKSLQQKKITPHALRHSIATHLLQNGMNIENISRFLGHSSLESTQMYTHLSHEL